MPFVHALGGYAPEAASQLKQSFWIDAANDGLANAIEKWGWFIR